LLVHDITHLISSYREIIRRHQLGQEGAYCRWLWQPKDPSKPRRQLGLNEYGCADAANMLYMIGDFPSDPAVREKWVCTLQSLQHPQSGMFTEETHHPIHTTAHCIAALELFDRKAVHPLKELQQYLEKDALYKMLDALEWKNRPAQASHQGAGLYAALTLQGEANVQWKQWYFDWMWEQTDPETGFLRKGHIPAVTGSTYFGQLVSTFHFMFNHESAHMPMRYPEKLIDTALDIFYEHRPADLGKAISFHEVDWVYIITRSMRQTPHRFFECKAALRTFADDYLDYLESLDPLTDDGLNDMHTLFGAICCLAELQSALPGEILTEKPLKLVLDRRPFI